MPQPQEAQYFHLYKKSEGILHHTSFRILGDDVQVVTWNKNWLHEIDRVEKVHIQVARKRYQSLLKEGFSKEK